MNVAIGRATNLVIGVALAWAAGGCSSMCDAERLPAGGQVADRQAMFTLAQYAARQDCCEVLYRLLSPATRAEHGETKFCWWWDSASLKLPPPHEYTVAEILKGGAYGGEFDYAPPGQPMQRFIYVHYRELFLQLLVVIERKSDGRDEPRLALKEQFDPEPPARPVAWNAGE